MNENERPSTSDIASAGDRVTEERPERMTQLDQGRPAATTTVQEAEQSGPTALFKPEDAGAMQSHWSEVQAAFVDDPRQAVQRADELVAKVIKRLADTFADERSKLEQQWSSGENVSTEDLRVALQRYRLFFDRLLSI
jgi:hypothetical protein